MSLRLFYSSLKIDYLESLDQFRAHILIYDNGDLL